MGQRLLKAHELLLDGWRCDVDDPDLWHPPRKPDRGFTYDARCSGCIEDAYKRLLAKRETIRIKEASAAKKAATGSDS